MNGGILSDYNVMYFDALAIEIVYCLVSQLSSIKKEECLGFQIFSCCYGAVIAVNSDASLMLHCCKSCLAHEYVFVSKVVDNIHCEN